MDIDAFKELPIIGILRGINLTEVNPLVQTIIHSGLKEMNHFCVLCQKMYAINKQNIINIYKPFKKITCFSS